LGIAVPKFVQMRAPWLLRQSAIQVASEFQKARMRAITRSARYRFTYNATNKSYTIDREGPAGTWTTEFTNALPTGAYITAPNANSGGPIAITYVVSAVDTPVSGLKTATVTATWTEASKTHTAQVAGFVRCSTVPCRVY